jgi:ribosomal protein L36
MYTVAKIGEECKTVRRNTKVKDYTKNRLKKIEGGSLFDT